MGDIGSNYLSLKMSAYSTVFGLVVFSPGAQKGGRFFCSFLDRRCAFGGYVAGINQTIFSGLLMAAKAAEKLLILSKNHECTENLVCMSSSRLYHQLGITRGMLP